MRRIQLVSPYIRGFLIEHLRLEGPTLGKGCQGFIVQLHSVSGRVPESP